jgi:hypothetical protein
LSALGLTLVVGAWKFDVVTAISNRSVDAFVCIWPEGEEFGKPHKPAASGRPDIGGAAFDWRY